MTDTLRVEQIPHRQKRSFQTRSKDGKHIETPMHANAFETFMENNMNINATARQLGVAHMAVRRWAVWFNWEERAQERNSIVNARIAEQGVERTVKMLESHFEVGSLLIDRGARFLLENGISNERDAIRALEVGVRIQRQVEELPDWMVKTQGASTQDLMSEANKLLEQLAALRAKREAHNAQFRVEGEGEEGGAREGEFEFEVEEAEIVDDSNSAGTAITRSVLGN